MNYWTKQSIEFAQQRNYLDELFKVYPVNPNLRRELSDSQVAEITRAYYSIGPLFKNWIDKNVIGVPILNNANEFLNAHENCILNASDSMMQEFATAILDGVVTIKCTAT